MDAPPPASDVTALLRDQVAYYSARAPEYDEWWEREGAYDFGEEFNRAWTDEIARARAALEVFRPTGDILELASGTGGWTVELARYAHHITAIDAASEMLTIGQSKLSQTATPVEWVVADVFDWEPPRRYDVVFFSFWLSHVPAERFERFWALVDAAVKPGGRFFFIDNAKPAMWPTGPDLSQIAISGGVAFGPRSTTDLAAERSIREIADGRRFRIVERHWSPEDLRADLEHLRWDAEVTETEWAFIYGHGTRRSSAG